MTSHQFIGVIILYTLYYITFVTSFNFMGPEPGFPLRLDYTDLFKRDEFGQWEASGLEPENHMTPDKMPFDHYAAQSEDQNVTLSWSFNEENITFKVSAKTTGWILLGFSYFENGKQKSDYAIMGNRDKMIYLFDMNLNDKGDYDVDREQNLIPMHTWETEDETFVIFTRPLVSCDKQDISITGDTLKVIWSLGAVDMSEDMGIQKIEGTNEGSTYLKLLNPMLPPLNLEEEETDIKTFELRVPNIQIPAKDHRHCIAFRFPVRIKHHVVQFEPLIKEGNLFNVRQITVRECSGQLQKLTVTPQSDYECLRLDKSTNCKTVTLSWGYGMPNFTYPNNVGYPIGQSLSYFVMDVKYENRRMLELNDSSGLRIYYTSALRSHELGVMTTGSLSRDSLIIPPKTTDFTVHGHCMRECLAMALPSVGHVIIFAVLMQAQETGRKIRVRHFRGGEELQTIAEDNRFNPSLQGTQLLSQNVHLMSGDNLIVECTYDTSDRDTITYVNNSLGGESCRAFISYYPKVDKLTDCETAPTEKVLLDTIGAERLADMRKSVEKFEWTYQRTKEYNTRLLNSKVYVHCGETLLDGLKPVPKITKPYVKEDACPQEEKSPGSGGNSIHFTQRTFKTIIVIFSIFLLR